VTTTTARECEIQARVKMYAESWPADFASL